MNDQPKIGFIMQSLLYAVAYTLDGLQALTTVLIEIPGLFVIPMFVGITGTIIFIMWFMFLPGSGRHFGEKLITILVMFVFESTILLDAGPGFAIGVGRLIHLSNKVPAKPAAPQAPQTVRAA